MLALLAWAFALLARGTPVLPFLLSPGAAYTLGEMVFWGALALVIVSVLQATSRRKPWFLAVEISMAGAVLVSLFAAHREGFINRPYGLVDPFWGRGYDPLPVFLALGAGVAVLLMVLAVARNRGRRSLLDLLLLGSLVLALFLAFPAARLKDFVPHLGGSSGKEGKEGKGKSQEGDAPSGGKDGKGRDTRPRESGPEGGQGSGQAGGQEALSSFANQSQQNTNQPVAVVLLHDDYDPPEGYFYFRQTAFSQYNGVRLVEDTTGKADRDLADAFPTVPRSLPKEPRNAKLVRPLETTVALMALHAKPFGLVNPSRFEPAPNPDPARFQRAYKVGSQVLSGPLSAGLETRPGSEGWDESLWGHYTAAPPDPRYEKLARECLDLLRTNARDNPFARAAAVKIFLEKKGTYSLSSNHEGASDPLADFLFGDRTGHCVYFAHSACLLFRTLGIPSRVGAGYAVEARNRGGGDALLVREKDAHAWPEVYLEGLGWTVLDIAPEKTLDPPQPAPDPGLQQMLGEMARKEPGNPKEDQKPAGGGDLQKAVKTAAKAAAAMAALVAALMLVALYGIKIWRRAAPGFCPEAQLPRVAYRACLDRLAEAGVVRPYGASREAFTRSGPQSRSLERLTALHLQAALGARKPRGDRATYRDLASRASAERSACVPAWRRALGWLDPFAWMRVR
jgi:transglutaminase-like putative cysteine protease